MARVISKFKFLFFTLIIINTWVVTAQAMQNVDIEEKYWHYIKYDILPSMAPFYKNMVENIISAAQSKDYGKLQSAILTYQNAPDHESANIIFRPALALAYAKQGDLQSAQSQIKIAQYESMILKNILSCQPIQNRINALSITPNNNKDPEKQKYFSSNQYLLQDYQVPDQEALRIALVRICNAFYQPIAIHSKLLSFNQAMMEYVSLLIYQKNKH